MSLQGSVSPPHTHSTHRIKRRNGLTASATMTTAITTQNTQRPHDIIKIRNKHGNSQVSLSVSFQMYEHCVANISPTLAALPYSISILLPPHPPPASHTRPPAIITPSPPPNATVVAIIDQIELKPNISQCWSAPKGMGCILGAQEGNVIAACEIVDGDLDSHPGGIHGKIRWFNVY